MSRADRVAARLADRGADLLLVTDLVNVRYLTGFTGTSAMAVVGPETRRFITDFRYVDRARAEVTEFDRERAPQEFAEALKSGWPEGRVRLGFEDQHMSVRQHKRLRELLPDRIELVPAGGAIEAERARKEPGEIEAIRAAAGLADDIYDWVRERGVVGRTEREVARSLEEEMRRRGASDPSFPSIVASAEHGALPHAEPRDVEIARRRARDPRPRGEARRLLLGLHAHVGHRRARRRSGGDLRPRPARPAGGARRRAARGPTGREIDAVARDLIAAGGTGTTSATGSATASGSRSTRRRAWRAPATTCSSRATW